MPPPGGNQPAGNQNFQGYFGAGINGFFDPGTATPVEEGNAQVAGQNAGGGDGGANCGPGGEGEVGGEGAGAGGATGTGAILGVGIGGFFNPGTPVP